MEQKSKLDGPQFREKLFVIFQNFMVVKPMPLFMTNVQLSVFDFFILSKNMCEKVNFSKTLKGRHLLQGGPMNIIFGRFLDI